MKKRVLTALLAVIMVVSLGTVSALADGSTLPAADSDGVITLTYDVTLAANAEVAAGETLNLNGFDITTSANATRRHGRRPHRYHGQKSDKPC